MYFKYECFIDKFNLDVKRKILDFYNLILNQYFPNPKKFRPPSDFPPLLRRQKIM